MEHINDIRKSGIDPSDIDADQYTSATPHINKPLELRTRLRLTQTQAGMLILCNPDETKACKTWYKIERKNRERDHMSPHVTAILRHINWLIDDDEIHLVRRMLGITT